MEAPFYSLSPLAKYTSINRWSPPPPIRKPLFRPVGTPARSDDQSLARGGTRDGTTVVYECRVEGHAVHIESDRGELDTEGEVMPFAVAHLDRREQGQAISHTPSQSLQHPLSCSGPTPLSTSTCHRLPKYLLQFPEKLDGTSGADVGPVEEREAAAVH